MESGTLFHESWYRISGQRLSLRSSVRVRRQLFRGARWYVLYDPFANQFFRLRPAAYGFVARLRLDRTVEDVWKEEMSRDPENTPGQSDVIELLAGLYHANLLHYELPPDSARLFERYKEQKQRLMRATLMNIMFFRIPLFDPDAILKRLAPLVRIVFSVPAALIWLGVVAGGIKEAVDNFEALRVQSQGLLAPSNIALLYLGLILIKGLHEFGHAFAVRRFGGEVHTMGVMFLIFNPLPYVDATSSWTFRSKWKRVLVGAAGMIVELFVAALAAFVWAATGPGTLNALAYNMMFIASVSTVVFNINPLLRFDGYYILSDLIDIPNLHSRASGHLRHLFERYAFGYRKSESPAENRTEAAWLTVFGILSALYRVVVFTGILLFVADRFLLAGLLMALVCAVSWVLVPVLKFLHYLATSPRLERSRTRAVFVSAGAALALLVTIYIVPVPSNFSSPGVVRATEHAVVVNSVEGTVRDIVAPSGSRVAPGDPLVSLQNEAINIRLRETDGSLQEAYALRQRALLSSQADLASIDGLIESIQKRRARLAEQRESLTVHAEIPGVWVAPELEDLHGMWLRRGTPLGQLINDSGFYFTSVISQTDSSRVFADQIISANVRLIGESGIDLRVGEVTRIPVERTDLPSMALGYGAGGEVAIDVTDASGTRAAEPFYEVRADVFASGDTKLFHGRTGRVRFQLPPEPLLVKWNRELRQLLQKRYQL